MSAFFVILWMTSLTFVEAYTYILASNENCFRFKNGARLFAKLVCIAWHICALLSCVQDYLLFQYDVTNFNRIAVASKSKFKAIKIHVSFV